MEAVDAFNHLIPSDQLDETLTVGTNTDCDGGNDLGSVHPLEESLKNMLSDEDPMFGCTSSQFNLLDNEDPAFPAAGSTGLGDGSAPKGVHSEPSGATPVKRPVGRPRKRPCNVEPELSSSSAQPKDGSLNPAGRGRPGRRPINRLQRSFLIEKGLAGADLKKELTLGGRVNVKDLDGGSWMSPSVVLRRLTVTIGGFKIELLPGPSYAEAMDAAAQSAYLDGVTCGPDVGFNVLPDDNVTIHNVAVSVPESTAEVNAKDSCSADDPALAPGPYVNPNDVQSANGTETESPGVRETKPNGDSNSHKAKEGKQAQSDEKNVNTKTDGKVKSLKSPLRSTKSKDLVASEPNHAVKQQKETHDVPAATTQREDVHKTKVLKEKKDVLTLKRPAENTHGDPATKVQKVQKSADDKAKPKLPGPLTKKSQSLSSRSDQQSPAKHLHPHSSAKAESAHATHNRLVHATRVPDEGGQEKSKVKKPEKILQKQKSKSSRSISVEEPQLFVPDNAPVSKKEPSEEQPANSETVWDGNNCCGLCKKHHNNMFMVGCGRCDDWFHGDCVGLDLAKVREMEEEDQMYVCLKCCEEESKKFETEAPSAAKPEVPTTTEDGKQPPKPRPGTSQAPPPGGGKAAKKDPDRRQSTDSFYKPAGHLKQEKKSKPPPSASKKPVSVDSIRRSVRDSLKEILTQRLKESDLKVSVEKALDVAKKTERELFHMYKDTDNKYKNKYRSLMFNLKDTKNNVLFKKVLKGDISPGNLIRMSPEELASKELAAWRKRENRHTIEMIEKEQREAERRPITKITHKGEIEIESQEPVKAPEPAELEPPPKAVQVPTEPPKTPEKREEAVEMEIDTTSLHKSHLFDLKCKICTGRVVAPVEEVPTKVVKVATTVARRPSAKSEETRVTTPAAMDDDLHLAVLEESFRSAQSGVELTTGRDKEATFLSSLKSLWRGFIHMHSVAKLVTKAFPVSGIMDHLTEDLPDSVQVGGRISPQIVWDYLEKIRATGTKEVCLIRFAPDTEEDEISYAVLYSYFNSRKRFGVVSNNRKQVKDMYLVPLDAKEKVPHQLVPFDGPGLESNRANLLLGLIIRQKPKRDFLPVDVNESARIVPETKPIAISTKDARTTEEEEKLFLSSLTTPRDKDKEKQLAAAEDSVELNTDALEEPAASESGSLESQRPLRFLPGVLVGWGGELPPLPDFSNKPAPVDEDLAKTLPAQKTEVLPRNTKSPTTAAAASRERFVIKKKEVKTVKAEPPPLPTNPAANSASEKDAVVTHGAPVSLKDKPPDVSTEAFLESLTAAPSGTETPSAASSSQSDKGTSEGNQSKPQDAPANLNSSAKPPLSGILKKSSAYPAGQDSAAVPSQKDPGGCLPPGAPKLTPVASGGAVTTFHQGLLQISQSRNQLEEANKSMVNQAASPPSVQTAEPPHNSVPGSGVPGQDGDALVQSQSPQPPGSYDAADQNHKAQESAGQRASPLAKDNRPVEERYTDPWERPRNTEHRDHHGRHGHHRDSHHGKKSRHRDREKRHERSYDEKGKERSRHYGHSDDRYGEKRKERDGHHKERHRHRRDSDYENGRRSSRDSYS